MNKLRQLAVIAIVSLFLVACSGGEAPKAETESGATAGNVDFPYMGVAELDKYLADNSGKPTMVLFWTTWCPSCKDEIPEMEQLNKSHGDKMNILTISLDENIEALEKFFSKGKLDLPVYIGDDGLSRKFQISAIPTLVIFDKTGKQTFGQAGVFPLSMLKAMADKLISQ